MKTGFKRKEEEIMLVRNRLILASTLAALLTLQSCLPVEKPSNGEITQMLPNGVQVRTRTFYDPSDFPDERGGSGVSGVLDGSVFHRVYWIGQRYFGYDVEVQRLSGTRKFQLMIEPLSVDWPTFDVPSVPGPMMLVPLPRYPAPQVVNEGDEIVLEVAENPATGHKMIDRIDLRDGAPLVWQLRK
jgi:hypothetical protein